MKRFIIDRTFVSTVFALMFFALVPARGQNPGNQPDRTIEAATRTQVIQGTLRRLNESYVFPDIAKKIEADILARYRRGEYDQIVSAQTFAQKLTAHLQAVSRDKHLNIRYSYEPLPPPPPAGPPSNEEWERMRRLWSAANHQFKKVERLDGNIGYLRLDGFSDPEHGMETVAAALNFITDTNALIIDLRFNGGGSPHMVALLASYFFGPEPVHLSDTYWRPADRIEEFWTRREVLGKRYGDKDVYILTSHLTFSAGEEFAYDLQALQRAKTIGEATGGGAHPGGVARLHDHFSLFVPSGRSINPITKTNWEGVGVKPDVEAQAEIAPKLAHLIALKQALKKYRRELLTPEKEEMRRTIAALKRELRDMRKEHPQKFSPETLKMILEENHEEN